MQQVNIRNPDCSSALAPRAKRANRATRKKPNRERSKTDEMTAAGKTNKETSQPDVSVRKPQMTLRMATVNVGTLVGRGAEVAETLGRRRVDIAALQEVRYKNEGVKCVRGGDFQYRLFWKGEKTGQGGVGLMVRKDLAESVMEVKRVSPRILAMELAVSGEVFSVISVYGPQSGRSEEEKDCFYDELSAEVQARGRKCIVLGDFNGHVGDLAEGYEGVHGGHGWGVRNREGERVLEFADSFGMVVCNTYFKKEDEKLITYKSGVNATVVDYILAERHALKRVRDVKVIPGEECFSQHRLLVMDVSWRQSVSTKAPPCRRVKLWRLREEAIRNAVREGVREEKQEPESWEQWSVRIMKVAADVCGTSRGRHERRSTWWWNEQVNEVIKEKRLLYKKWQKDKGSESKKQYLMKKREAKRAVAAAKEKENKYMTEKLERNNVDGLRDLFKMARQSEKDKRDIVGMPYVRGKNGELKVTLSDKIKVWKEYAEKLLNEENEWDGRLDAEMNEGPCEEISEDEVKDALSRMKVGKAAGPSGVTAELLKVCGVASVKRLMEVANGLLEGKKMPDCWRKSEIIPLYKGKGDARSCGSYRSVKLLEHGMKVVERIFEKRLRKVVTIDEMQMGFMPGKGTVDAIFSVRQLMEKYENAGKKLHMVFVDLEKAFDRVPRRVIWWALRRKGVMEREIQVIKEMYQGARTAVRVENERSEWFEVKVGVHQGSVLSPLLFAVVMDVISSEVREGGVKELLYADDLVLLGDSWQEVRERYARWKKALEAKGLKVNVSKTKVFCTGERTTMTLAVKDPCSVCGRGVQRNSIKCLKCRKWVHKRCSGVRGQLMAVRNFECKRCCGLLADGSEESVSLDGDIVEKVDKFCYLGDVLCTDGGVQGAVIARTRAGWKKFKELTKVLCMRGLSLKLKGIVYKSCVRSVMSYGAECWAMKVDDLRKMETTEMRMLRLMCGKTLKDRVRSEKIREMTGVEKIEEFLRDQRLRWFGHVERMSEERAPVKAMRVAVDGKKRGRPKMRWREVVEKDMELRGLERVDAQERTRWRRGCKNRPTPASGECVPGPVRRNQTPTIGTNG